MKPWNYLDMHLWHLLQLQMVCFAHWQKTWSGHPHSMTISPRSNTILKPSLWSSCPFCQSRYSIWTACGSKDPIKLWIHLLPAMHFLWMGASKRYNLHQRVGFSGPQKMKYQWNCCTSLKLFVVLEILSMEILKYGICHSQHCQTHLPIHSL